MSNSIDNIRCLLKRTWRGVAAMTASGIESVVEMFGDYALEPIPQATSKPPPTRRR
jgi:hypothetical protein